MPEIILLYFLCRNIGNKAREKGIKPLRWQILTIVSFILFEGLGINIALSWLGLGTIKNMKEAQDALINHPGIVFFSLFVGFGGYLLVRKILESRADRVE